MKHFPPRHSGPDPESSDAASKGSNALQSDCRAPWIPAFAGMTHIRHSGLDPGSSEAAPKGTSQQKASPGITIHLNSPSLCWAFQP